MLRNFVPLIKLFCTTILTDKPLDSSLNSQASILDEVYKVSLHEENVRHELGAVDIKITTLQSLIDEASQQLKQFTSQRHEVCAGFSYIYIYIVATQATIIKPINYSYIRVRTDMRRNV